VIVGDNGELTYVPLRIPGRPDECPNLVPVDFAAAAAACLTPTGKENGGEELAWTTAMNARMARVCEKIAQGEGYDNSEVGRQYEILRAFLDAS